MRLLYMANNQVGLEALRWLIERGQAFAGLVVHPEETAKYRDEILAAADPLGVPVWDADTLRDPRTVAGIRDTRPDLILSVLFGYILKPEILTLPRRGALNLHNGYLPFNAGSYANVWCIVDGTPAGATLHYMDDGIDTGDIAGRREVPVLPDDTGQSIYARVERAQIELLKETWDAVLEGSAPRQPQDPGERTCHVVADAEQIDEIRLDESYRAADLINILRARTYPPHRGAWFVADGRRYYVSIAIDEAEG